MLTHSLTQLSPEKSKWLILHMYKLAAAAAAAHMHHKSPALFTFLVLSSAIHNSGRQMSNDTLSHPAPCVPCMCVLCTIHTHVNALLPDMHVYPSTPLVKPSTFVSWSSHTIPSPLFFPATIGCLCSAPTYTLCLFLRILQKQ